MHCNLRPPDAAHPLPSYSVITADTLRYAATLNLTLWPWSLTLNMRTAFNRWPWTFVHTGGVVKLCTKFERNRAIRGEVIAISIFDLMTLNIYHVLRYAPANCKVSWSSSTVRQRHAEVRSATIRLADTELHWLDVPEIVQFKLCDTVHRCLQRKAPQYLIDHCISVSEIASRQHLRSASRHQLVVPRYRRSTFGYWAFVLLAQRSGACWQTISGILDAPLKVSDAA